MVHVKDVRKRMHDEESWGVLYLDGHSSHRSAGVFRLLESVKIDFVEIYPHSSHIDQPLDLRIYCAWKKALKKVPLYHCVLFLTA